MTCWLCNQPTPEGLTVHPVCYRNSLLAKFGVDWRDVADVNGETARPVPAFSPGSEWGTWGDSGKSSEVYEWKN